MEDNTRFLKHINDNYDEIKLKLKMLCGRNKQSFDDDAMQEAIIRCHTAITKKGKLNDNSAYGIESYLIRSYFNYIKEVKRSCAVSKRDLNINSDNIGDVYEIWYNSNNDTSRTKILKDLYKDFATLYIMHIVEDNFDSEHFYLFRLKTLIPDMTYKKLSETTKLKAVRQKVIEVKNYIKSNVTKDDINKAFYLMYGDLI